MIIDSHQHFWQLARGDYPWPNEDVAPIFRDFGPEELNPLLKTCGVDRTVLVQATDTIAETRFLLDIAARNDRVAAVVGWVDLSAHDAIQTIDQLRQDRKLKGLRPMLQSIEETGWILCDEVQPVLRHMTDHGLRFDALTQPRHLPVIDTLAARYPDLSIVIDHIAKPAIGRTAQPDRAWEQGMTALANHPNIFCKLSGMVTEAQSDWRAADLQPYAQTVLELFGADRVMFGSDWPVVNLASDYANWFETVRALIAPLGQSEKDKILGQTAARFYEIGRAE